MPKLKESRHASLAEWTAVFRGNRGKTLAVIKETMILHCKSGEDLAAVAVPAEVVRVEGLWLCSVCGKDAGAKQALAVHEAREHRILRPACDRSLEALAALAQFA